MSRQNRYLAAAIFFAISAVTVHLFDLDDRAWYLWLDWKTPQASKHNALWLPHYEVDVEAMVIKGVDGNLSGITFNSDSGSFWVIINQPQQLIELDKDLKPLRLIELENFADTEAIAYAGNSTYIIADERDQSIVVAPINQATQSLNKDELHHLTINIDGNSNKGLEGVTVDYEKQTIYAVRERDPMRLISVKGILDKKPGINVEFPPGIDVGDLYMDDLSGLHFDSGTGHLLILSDESKMLAEVDLQGNKISYMDLDVGFNNLKYAIPQAEGVTLDADNNLYIISEPNLIYRFRKAD